MKNYYTHHLIGNGFIFKNTQWILVLLLLAILLMSGCHSESKRQQQAFITYLNTEIINQRIVKTCSLTAQQRQTFGPYAANYDILFDFMNQTTAALIQASGSTNVVRLIQSDQDALQYRNELLQEVATMDALIATQHAISEETHQKYQELTLPADVKNVFDAAYKKTVTPMDDTFTSLYALSRDRVHLLLDMATILQNQGNRVHFQDDGKAVFTDPAAQRTYTDKKRALFDVQYQINPLIQKMIEFIKTQQ